VSYTGRSRRSPASAGPDHRNATGGRRDPPPTAQPHRRNPRWIARCGLCRVRTCRCASARVVMSFGPPTVRSARQHRAWTRRHPYPHRSPCFQCPGRRSCRPDLLSRAPVEGRAHFSRGRDLETIRTQRRQGGLATAMARAAEQAPTSDSDQHDIANTPHPHWE